MNTYTGCFLSLHNLLLNRINITDSGCLIGALTHSLLEQLSLQCLTETVWIVGRCEKTKGRTGTFLRNWQIHQVSSPDVRFTTNFKYFVLYLAGESMWRS